MKNKLKNWLESHSEYQQEVILTSLSLIAMVILIIIMAFGPYLFHYLGIINLDK